MENMVASHFWQNKKVLITGHTGFKGSWLALWLQELKAQVSGYALAPATHPNLFTLANVAEGMQSTIADIRDFESVKAAIKNYQPEIIIHMAAQPLVRYSYQNPIETYATNVMGTVNLLEAARQMGGVKTIVNVTTDKCYENKEWQWAYRENERLGGYDPYSNSKACSELVTSAYRNSYFNTETYGKQGVALASARAGNVIGGGDWSADRLIPDIIRSLIAKKPVVIRNPHAIRPWQHVLEPLSGYLLLAEKLCQEPSRFAESWNFGPNEEDAKPVHWIADHVTQLLGNDTRWIVDQTPQPHEATYLKLDCAKAKSLLSWQPRWSIATGLTETVNWYLAHQAGRDMRTVSVAQINSYLNTTGKSS